MRKWYPLVIILIGYAAGAAVFARLPGRVPTHFDAHGIANGWSSRWFAVLFLPTLAMGVWPVMRLLPRIDPRRANYQRFQDTYDTVVNVVLTVLIVVHLLILALALGLPLDLPRVMPAIIGAVLVVIGNLLPKARPNWWFGIRTPWTLSSDRVWERTHRVGGYIMMIAGLVAVAGALLPRPMSEFVIAATIAVAALSSVAYSYFAWRQETRNGGQAADTRG